MNSNHKHRLKLVPVTPTEGVAVFQREDGSECVHGYGVVREGENIAGRTVLALNKSDGTYEQIPTGAKPMRCAHGGPAQVATEEYRESWERTFGSRGGIS